MAVITTSAGKDILVDDADYVELSKHSWFVTKRGYAQTHLNDQENRPLIVMHRLIMGPASHVDIDHINGNPRDNRRANLRFCNKQQNAFNRRPNRGCSSALKGVRLHRQSGLWQARIKKSGASRSLGYFKTEEAAARAYNVAAERAFGDFAYLNEDAV